MNRIVTLCFISSFLFPLKLRSQGDTILVYDFLNQSISKINPVASNTNITFNKTNHNTGSMAGLTNLSLTAPLTNLYPNSNFTQVDRAAKFMDVTTFPARTGIALRSFTNGIEKPYCSGILIAPNFALTAAHCVIDIGLKTFTLYDSAKVVSGYDNGIENPAIPSSAVSKAYIFKSFYSGTGWSDIALIELKKPIGLQVGWVGIAYDTNSVSYTQKIFHKFSYPAQANPFNPGKNYNGDTLYYNYGKIEPFSGGLIGLPLTSNQGLPGQSGSSFLYTDNLNDYYSVGVFSFSSSYGHVKISPDMFYQLKNILDLNPVGVKKQDYRTTNVNLYPNPFSEILSVDLPLQSGDMALINFKNSLGQSIRSISLNAGSNSVSCQDLSPGFYIVELYLNQKLIYTNKCFKI